MEDQYIPGMGKPNRKNRKTEDERVVYATIFGLLSLPVVALFLASSL